MLLELLNFVFPIVQKSQNANYFLLSIVHFLATTQNFDQICCSLLFIRGQFILRINMTELLYQQKPLHGNFECFSCLLVYLLKLVLLDALLRHRPILHQADQVFDFDEIERISILKLDLFRVVVVSRIAGLTLRNVVLNQVQ